MHKKMQGLGCIVKYFLTTKVPRPISCQKTQKTAMFVALAQENKIKQYFGI